MKKFLPLFFQLFLCISLNGQVPQILKKTVSFIYQQVGEDKISAIGTGFFINMKSQKDTNVYYLYFVTAKHVLLDSNGNYNNNLLIRINEIDTSSRYHRLGKLYNNMTVFIHSNKDIDLAVIPIVKYNDSWDIKHLSSEELIFNRQDFKKANFSEGIETFFMGLFTSYDGRKISYPIVRFGRIALISNEGIPINHVLKDVILVESSSYGGNSGSPMFFRNKNSYCLGGIVSGTFLANSEVKTLPNKNIEYTQNSNGICYIVPAYYLDEILNSDILIKKRK